MSQKSRNSRLSTPYQQGDEYDFRRRSDRLRWARENAMPPYNDAEFVAKEVVMRSVKTVYSWENRSVELKDVDTLTVLAQFYNVSFSWLAAGIGPRVAALPSQQEAYLLAWFRQLPGEAQDAYVQFLTALGPG